MRLGLLLLLVPLLLSGCLCCALPPTGGNPAPLPTVTNTPTPHACGGSATFDVTRNAGGAAQNFRPGIRLAVGESYEVDQARIELKRAQTISGVPVATFRYYYAGGFQREITGSATPQDDLHELPGTTYGIRVTEVTSGTC